VPFGKVANLGVQFPSFLSNMASMRVVFILYMMNRRFWQETVSVLIQIVVIVCIKVCILFIGTVFLV
jgi:hypothetical protein